MSYSLRVLVTEDSKSDTLESVLWNNGFAFYEFSPEEVKKILSWGRTLDEVEAIYEKK